MNERSQRFSELRRTVPDVSQRMLTSTLRKLERDGYVWRQETQTVPVRVDYGLTDLGISLLQVLAPLASWALDHREPVAKARALFDGRDTK